VARPAADARRQPRAAPSRDERVVRQELKIITVRAAILAAGLGFLAACSSFLPKLESPKLSVVGMEVVKADLLQQQLRVRMHVQNPNDRALPVRGITYKVLLSGEEFAHGESERDFTVPARGEMEFDVNVIANAAPVLLKYFASGRRDPLAWRIEGKVQLAGGLIRSVPFNQSGELKLR
jgi:LEA14-like dessication related protein